MHKKNRKRIEGKRKERKKKRNTTGSVIDPCQKEEV